MPACGMVMAGAIVMVKKPPEPVVVTEAEAVPVTRGAPMTVPRASAA